MKQLLTIMAVLFCLVTNAQIYSGGNYFPKASSQPNLKLKLMFYMEGKPYLYDNIIGGFGKPIYAYKKKDSAWVVKNADSAMNIMVRLLNERDKRIDTLNMKISFLIKQLNARKKEVKDGKQ